MPEEQDGGPVKRGRDSEPSRLGFQACHGLFQVEQVDSLLSFSFSIRNVGVIAAAWKDCRKDHLMYRKYQAQGRYLSKVILLPFCSERLCNSLEVLRAKTEQFGKKDWLRPIPHTI